MPIFNNASMKQYILRKLGYPVISRIEISDDQLEDCIDEGVSLFTEKHEKGATIGYVRLDIKKDQKEYTLNSNIKAVMDIQGSAPLSGSTEEDRAYLGDIYGGYGNALMNTGCGVDLVSVEMYRQHLDLIRKYFTNPIMFKYNEATNKLTLFAEPKNDLDTLLKVYECPEDLSEILSDRWLKKYCVQLAKYQWGTNLDKFVNYKMRGGAEFNARALKEEASQEIERLEQELIDVYDRPPMPMIG